MTVSGELRLPHPLLFPFGNPLKGDAMNLADFFPPTPTPPTRPPTVAETHSLIASYQARLARQEMGVITYTQMVRSALEDLATQAYSEGHDDGYKQAKQDVLDVLGR